MGVEKVSWILQNEVCETKEDCPNCTFWNIQEATHLILSTVFFFRPARASSKSVTIDMVCTISSSCRGGKCYYNRFFGFRVSGFGVLLKPLVNWARKLYCGRSRMWTLKAPSAHEQTLFNQHQASHPLSLMLLSFLSFWSNLWTCLRIKWARDF